MRWRIDTRRMTGRKAEPIALLEVTERELDHIAKCVEDNTAWNETNPPDLQVELRAAHVAVVAQGRR